jgi:hypothetical protein
MDALYRGETVVVLADDGGSKVRIRRPNGSAVWVWRKQLRTNEGRTNAPQRPASRGPVSRLGDLMPIFNVVASYKDSDGGMYEWEGEATDSEDAIRCAQAQAMEDNGAEDPEMLDDVKGFSVIDVTAKYALKAEITAALREEADKLDRTRHPDITDVASERADYLRNLADRFESAGTHV